MSKSGLEDEVLINIVYENSFLLITNNTNKIIPVADKKEIRQNALF
jgi:hypothetical protein